MTNDSLTYKKVITDAKGNRILDICAPTMDIETLVMLQTAPHFVTEEESSRIDKIVNSYYGDVTEIDLVLRSSGVSDPFSIDAFDLLFLPDRRVGEELYIPPKENKALGEPSEPSVSQQISAGGAKLTKAVKDNGNKSPKTKELPATRLRRSNVLGEGQSPKIVDGRSIILGTSVPNRK